MGSDEIFGRYENYELIELIDSNEELLIAKQNMLLEYAFCEEEDFEGIPLQDALREYISIGFIVNSHLKN